MNFHNDTLEQHNAALSELIQRDKNHPAVIMWSVANEPASNNKLSEIYLK